MAIPRSVTVERVDPEVGPLMRHLTFMDVVGLHGLATFVCRLDQRGIEFFAYNWPAQSLRLMDLIDGLYPQPSHEEDRGGPTRLLRRSLQGSAAAVREVGAARARKDVQRPAPFSSR
ncbi:hypothetical protein [Streptomyces sp. NPDC051000]|uniref:hypothetical protein n=1 Tax=Streptomyces sp. NPDC051000 TaxID=3155520 RepID=UPI0034097342